MPNKNFTLGMSSQLSILKSNARDEEYARSDNQRILHHLQSKTVYQAQKEVSKTFSRITGIIRSLSKPLWGTTHSPCLPTVLLALVWAPRTIPAQPCGPAYRAIDVNFRSLYLIFGFGNGLNYHRDGILIKQRQQTLRPGSSFSHFEASCGANLRRIRRRDI